MIRHLKVLVCREHETLYDNFCLISLKERGMARKIISKKHGFPNFTQSNNCMQLCDNQKLIISDIWSFWDYIIKKKQFKKSFMLSLLEQARYFYSAAETSPLRSKPLLYYYSFLNLAKIIINLDKEYGNQGFEYYHGLQANCNGISKFEEANVELYIKKTGYQKQVAIELLESLDELSLSSKLVLNIKDLLSHCVGIHRTYSEIYGSNEIFCRLSEEELYKDGKTMIFSANVRCNEDESLLLKSRGYNIRKEKSGFIWEESFDTTRYTFARDDYYFFSKQLRDKGIWYYIGKDGYVNYLSTKVDYRYSPEMIIYNTMFFLGSITRYHPYLFDSIFSNKEQWLMSEFLTTQPKQFVYSATAKILSQPVLKAYADF